MGRFVWCGAAALGSAAAKLTMNPFIIQTRNLTKTFGHDVVALSGLDLRIERGAVYGLIGRNGAGKTTTLRLLMGLLHPTQGAALVLGQELRTARASDRARVAYVSQSQQLPSWMSLSELCRCAAAFYPRWDRGFARSLAKEWGLQWERPVSQFSGGEQRKAALFLALATRPEVLLLDEPAAGLDPIARRELIDALIGLCGHGGECTVLFCTHILSDLERIADSVGILDRGRLVLNGRLDALQSRTQRVQIIFPGEMPPPRLAIPGALRCTVAGPVVTAVIQATDPEAIEKIQRWPGVRVQVFPMGLEEIFLELVGRNLVEQEDGEIRIGELEEDPSGNVSKE
jgi:ABC-2 type transport system ATP-binding protein